MIHVMTAVPKPVSIEGVFFDGTYESFEEITKWIQSFPPTADPPGDISLWDGDREEFFIVTLEGQMHVAEGSIVLRGLIGEFYPCKPHVYSQKYNVVKVSEFKCD